MNIKSKIIWKSVKGYEGYYEISNTGLIRSVKRKVAAGKTLRTINERILKSRKNNYGYEEVRLSKKGISKTRFVHILLAQAFIENHENKPEINHINGIKDDNRLENIAWVTHSENMKHAYESGLIKPKGKVVIDICSGTVYMSTKQAAKAIGINYSTLKNILSGHSNRRLECLQYRKAA